MKLYTIRDEACTALYATYTVKTVYTVDMVYTCDNVDTVDTVYTVYTIKTALHSCMPTNIVRKGKNAIGIGKRWE